MTVRQANQNFSQVIAAAETGETIIITKNGTPVARIVPQPTDRSADPEWQRAYEVLKTSLSRPRPNMPVGVITEDDLYGEGP